MMLTFIEHACDPERDYGMETRRIKNLKKQMCVIRGVTDSWSELTEMCANRTDPPPVMLRKILDEITAAGQGIRVSEVLCIRTHVFFTQKIRKSLRNVEILVDYILDRSYIPCVNHL